MSSYHVNVRPMCSVFITLFNPHTHSHTLSHPHTHLHSHTCTHTHSHIYAYVITYTLVHTFTLRHICSHMYTIPHTNTALLSHLTTVYSFCHFSVIQLQTLCLLSLPSTSETIQCSCLPDASLPVHNNNPFSGLSIVTYHS